MFALLDTISIILILTSPIYGHMVVGEPEPEPEPTPSPCNPCCQGPGGIPGVPGIPGSAGPLGPPGPNGSNGPKGDLGQPGISVKGERGDRGDIGEAGPPGPQGPQGTPGSDGVRGEKGNKGDAGATSRFVGFTAVKTISQTGPAGSVVTFDEVLTNAGDHYNVETSTFTSQTPGFYLFTFSIGARDDQYPYAVLVKNNRIELMDAYSRGSGTGTNYRAMASNSAVLNLVSGDTISVKFHNDQEIYGSSGWKCSTFSGMLLHKVE